MFSQQQAVALFRRYKAVQRATRTPTTEARRALEHQISAAASARPPDELQLLALLQKHVEYADGAAFNMVSVPDRVYARGGRVHGGNGVDSWVLMDPDDGARYDVERTGRVRLARSETQASVIYRALLRSKECRTVPCSRVGQAMMRQIAS